MHNQAEKNEKTNSGFYLEKNKQKYVFNRIAKWIQSPSGKHAINQLRTKQRQSYPIDLKIKLPGKEPIGYSYLNRSGQLTKSGKLSSFRVKLSSDNKGEFYINTIYPK